MADPEGDIKRNKLFLGNGTQRTPVQNCVMFAMPLVLLVVAVLMLFTSGSESKNLVTKSIKGDNDLETCATCPTAYSTGACYATDSPVLGGLDFVHYYDNTEEGTNGQLYQAGSPSYSSVYQGYTFQFISKDNQAKFELSPATYAPQYGGFCTWGITGEYCPTYAWAADCLGLSGDWKYGYKYNGKIYFFYGSGAASKFFADSEYYLGLGDERWVSWYGTTKTVFDTTCYVSA
jgi:YHS domain-containing protein